MIKLFRLPDLGEGLTESEIVTWMVAEGETVQLDQVLAEVETAKAAVELPSPYAGVVERLYVPEGTTVPVGSVLISFRVDDSSFVDGEEPAAPVPDPVDPQPQAAAAPAPEPAAEPVGMPQETVERGPVDALVADRESDQEPAGESDTLSAPPPNLVGYGAGANATGTPVRRPRRFPSTSGRRSAPDARPIATPPVRHLAASLGVDLGRLAGTGPDGLVTRADVERAGRPGPATAATRAPAVASAPAATPASAAAAVSPGDGVERVPVRGVRKLTAAAMVASAAVPQVTVFTTVDVTPTLDLLDARRDADGRAPTFLAAVARALCLAVRRHPEVNARWDEAAQEIVRTSAVHLAVAVAAPRGLLVPVLRDAHREDLPGLGRRIRELAQTARAGRSTPTDLSGGTITVSNVGVFGVDAGTPLLHDGQAAILAVGAVARHPWEWRGELALRSTVTLSLSIDHRVLDGEQGSRFLADLGRILADPGLAFVL